ncbi:MAG: protein kinase domain-containing protein, partial [Persicimonas sp.]
SPSKLPKPAGSVPKPAGSAPKPRGAAPPPTPAMPKRAPGVRHATEAPAEPTTLRTGDTVGGAFVVQRYLGSSGGGVSYLCEEKDKDNQVVIKVLSMPYPGDDGFDELRERIKVASSIRHRNLTKILGMGTTADDEMFVAMEYVRGSTVSGVVAQRREAGENLTLRDVFTILAHACDALEAVHKRTAHGVLTPYNLYLSHKGVVKVGNLTFARIAGEYLARERNSGPFVDSIYVAPEAARNPSDLAPSADLFSLGMLAAELISAKGLPNDRKRARHVALDGMGKYPPSLVNLIASCIDSAPENRPQSVRVFRETFEDAAREAGETLAGSPAEGCLPIEPAVKEEASGSLADEDSDLFDIDLPGFGSADADTSSDGGEERYLVQKSGLDYGPFTKEQVLEQLYADDIDENTAVLDRVTQERIELGEMEAFEEEVAEYIPIREERLRREAEARAELERKVKKGASAGLMIAVAAGVLMLGVMIYQYATLPDPEALPMDRAFASLDYKFLPPPKDFETVAVDKDLMQSIFNPQASEAEIARKLKRRAKTRAGSSKSRAKSGADSNVTEVNMADGAGSKHHLSDHEINQIITSRFGQLRSCIMQELNSNQSFKGVTVQFFIRPSGTTGGVKINESKYANRPVGQCLKQRFRAMKFPEHGAISNKGVTYPLRVQ